MKFADRLLLMSVFAMMLQPAAASAQVPFSSYKAFRDSLFSIGSMPNQVERDSTMNAFFNALKAGNQIPFAMNDSVAFLYRGAATSVKWNGDFNQWGSASTVGVTGTKVGASAAWILEKTFPRNARLDYKVVLNGNNWILDPDNLRQQWSGFGPNSELRMPDYIYPAETILASNILRGTLTVNFTVSSASLGYSVNYRVYTPAGYSALTKLPVIYVTDGHEYSDDKLGSMIVVMDNLIASGAIRPVMAVFIDPRNPSNQSQNRRQAEYTINPNFLSFVKTELVPAIDAAYKTDTAATARAILGTSLGGINSAYFGSAASSTFGLLAIHSPAFWFKPEIFASYQNAPLLPLKIYMTTGTIYDTQSEARQMRDILLSKGYPLYYKEVSEGHSWGNWRALLDEMLVYFFSPNLNAAEGGGTGAGEIKTPKPVTSLLLSNYPNPFNPSTTIRYELPVASTVSLKVYDTLGREVKSLVTSRQAAGRYETAFDASGLSSGMYFYRLATETGVVSRRMILVK